jgi:hypothetical protein
MPQSGVTSARKPFCKKGQGLFMYPRLVLNFGFSCLRLLSAGITGMTTMLSIVFVFSYFSVLCKIVLSVLPSDFLIFFLLK